MEQPVVSGEEISERAILAEQVAVAAGRLAAQFFGDRALAIETKGRQDFVSEADRAVERLIRAEIAGRYPDDGLYGEELGWQRGGSDRTWLFDPIDGTTCFLSGLRTWVISMAVIVEGRVEVAVIHDPLAGETFSARRGGGARLNGEPLPSLVGPDGQGLGDGLFGMGISHRSDLAAYGALVTELLEAGGMPYRNGSGAHMLAQVAAGRLVGYYEPHMQPWDSLAGLLLVAEAGGSVEPLDTATALERGGLVFCGAPAAFTAMRGLLAL